MHTSQKNNLLGKDEGDFRAAPHCRLLPFRMISPLAFLCENIEHPQISKHLLLLSSSCPDRFYGRCTRWWWNPVHMWGCWGPVDAEHVQVPFGTRRRSGAPRYTWVCSDFVISLLSGCSHLARVTVWIMPFSPLIGCSQLPFYRAYPDPRPPWDAECGEEQGSHLPVKQFWLLWVICSTFSSFGQGCFLSISDISSIDGSLAPTLFWNKRETTAYEVWCSLL